MDVVRLLLDHKAAVDAKAMVRTIGSCCSNADITWHTIGIGEAKAMNSQL
jgi:hypothetical protein